MTKAEVQACIHKAKAGLLSECDYERIQVSLRGKSRSADEQKLWDLCGCKE